MEGKDKRVSRRDALKRMAKASVGVGMGLQLIGAFVPAAHAATTAVQGPRFTTIGHVASAVTSLQAAAAENSDRSGTYTNGAGYSNGNTYYYDQYVQYKD